MSKIDIDVILCSQSLNAASLATFETDSGGFVRAMDLYGVSLRKGEAPDGISRKGEAFFCRLLFSSIQDANQSISFYCADVEHSAKCEITSFAPFVCLSTTILSNRSTKVDGHICVGGEKT